MIIDWLSVTVHADDEHKQDLWNNLFRGALGSLVDLGHGGQGFRKIETALEGAKVYSNPTKKDQEYYHLVFPGKACTCLVPSVYPELFEYLKDKKIKVTRLDLAFDAQEGFANNIDFTPHDFYIWCKSENIETFANRQSIMFVESPFKLQEDGVTVGTSTAYIGSRASDRMVRVYDMHGIVRLEFELKNDRAHAIAMMLFGIGVGYAQWEEIGKSNLQQYIDFPEWDEWQFFIGSVIRSDLKVGAARRLSLERSKEYIQKQVAPTLSVLADVMGEKEFTGMLNYSMEVARRKGRDRYKNILDAVKQNIEDEFLD